MRKYIALAFVILALTSCASEQYEQNQSITGEVLDGAQLQSALGGVWDGTQFPLASQVVNSWQPQRQQPLIQHDAISYAGMLIMGGMRPEDAYVQGAKMARDEEMMQLERQRQNMQSYLPRIGCAENGSCYGDISSITARPKTVRVRGYYRKNGTYVRGHYRSHR